MTYFTVRRSVARILNPAAQQTVLERAGNIAISALILANVIAVVLESMPSLEVRFASLFAIFERFSITAFAIEYILRLWTCVEMPAFRHPVLGRLRFVVSLMALVDLAVILPAYLPVNYAVDLRFARIIRTMRMLRVLKLARYSKTLLTFAVVFRAKRPDLAIMTIFLVILVVLASSLMYFVEHSAQPEAFSSIPAAMWWSVMTLTTVGYGDMYPITPLGKFLGAIIAVIGIGFFALPAGVLAAGFADEVARQRTGATVKKCPHCGEEIA